MSIRGRQGLPLPQDRPHGRLTRGLAGSTLLRRPWHRRALAAATVLVILLASGAIGPHLVHHTFDSDHEQVCLLATQANHHPWLGGAESSVAPLQLIQPWQLIPAPLSPQTFFTSTSFARAPPPSHL